MSTGAMAQVVVEQAGEPLDAGSAPGEREQLWQLVSSLEGQLHSLTSRDRSPVPLRGLEDCAVANPREHLADALSREAEAVDSDLGLRVNGFYTSDSVTDQDGREGFGFVELSWDLLEQGLRGNNREAERLRTQAELERLLAGEDSSRQRLRCQRDRIHQLFAPLTLDGNSILLRLLEPVYEYERRAYFRGWAFLDELLVSERDLLLVRREVEYLDDVARDTAAVLPPIIDVDMEALLAAIDADRRFERAQALNNSMTKAQYEAQQRQRLRLFLRQQVDRTGNFEDVIAGVRFSIPIGAPKTLALEERLRYNEASANLASWERTAIVRSAYIEVREQLERVIKSHYAYQRSEERLRRSLAEHRLGGTASLPAAVERLKASLSGFIELLNTTEVLYRRIGELLVHSRLPYDERFISFVPLDDAPRARNGERAAYLWSDEFAAVDNRRLLDLAAARRIDRLSVSAGQSADLEKIRDFLALERRPQVELLLGDAAWIRPEKADAAIARVLRRAEQFPGMPLHLDVEPQQLKGYTSQRQELLEDYLAFMEELRRRLPPDTALRLSVPAHWPPALYVRLAALADELSVMAYGFEGERAIDRALALGSIVPARKLRWVVRPADFGSEWLMEELLRELVRETELRRFAFHGDGALVPIREGADEAP